MTMKAPSSFAKILQWLLDRQYSLFILTSIVFFAREIDVWWLLVPAYFLVDFVNDVVLKLLFKLAPNELAKLLLNPGPSHFEIAGIFVVYKFMGILWLQVLAVFLVLFVNSFLRLIFDMSPDNGSETE